MIHEKDREILIQLSKRFDELEKKGEEELKRYTDEVQSRSPIALLKYAIENGEIERIDNGTNIKCNGVNIRLARGEDKTYHIQFIDENERQKNIIYTFIDECVYDVFEKIVEYSKNMKKYKNAMSDINFPLSKHFEEKLKSISPESTNPIGSMDDNLPKNSMYTLNAVRLYPNKPIDINEVLNNITEIEDIRFEKIHMCREGLITIIPKASRFKYIKIYYKYRNVNISCSLDQGEIKHVADVKFDMTYTLEGLLSFMRSLIDVDNIKSGKWIDLCEDKNVISDYRYEIGKYSSIDFFKISGIRTITTSTLSNFSLMTNNDCKISTRIIDMIFDWVYNKGENTN